MLTDDEKRKLLDMVASQSPLAAEMMKIARQGASDFYNALSDNGRKTVTINGRVIPGSDDAGEGKE